MYIVMFLAEGVNSFHFGTAAWIEKWSGFLSQLRLGGMGV